MRLFKFLVPDDRDYPLHDGSGVSARGCVAVALAADVDAAREVVAEAASLAGRDVRWLAVAIVTEVPLDRPRLVAISM